MSTAVFLEKLPEVHDAEIETLEKLIRTKYTVASGFDEPQNVSLALQKSLRCFSLLEKDCMTPKEFYETLQKINCGSNRIVIEKLFNRYDCAGKGVITVSEFANGLMGISPPAQTSPQFCAFLQRLRETLQQRSGNSHVTFRELTRTLRIIDDNGNKSLSPEELKTGLQDLGIFLSDAQFKEAFQKLDRDGSGSIDVTEFIVAIRGRMTPPRREIVYKAFLCLERNGDGRVTMQDLELIYKTANHPLVLEGKKTPREVLQEFSSAWNKNGDDEITFDEFCEYYDDISASIDSDTYFELMIRNAWHISGGEGLAQCTTTRRVLVYHMDGTCTIEEIVNDLGVDWTDEAEVKKRLYRQGITDVLRVEFNS